MSRLTPHILRDCHRLRKHLRDLKDEIDRGPRVLKAHETKLAHAEQAHKDAYDTIKKLKLKQKDDEGTLKTVEAHLAKLQTRAMEVTTMKEMDANRTEIATATGKKDELEEAILTAIMEIEARTADLPNVEARWAAAQKEFADYKIEAKERLGAMIADQADSNAKLAAFDATLPADVQAVYGRLVKSYGADGLAAVVGRVCQQCRQMLTEDKTSNLEMGQYIACSNCGRGLYIEG